ncbi:MAG: spore cortex biosynthesis protein YabQ [Defluviitaleaceae bacterium]|nr:spore cortex biosynthesis protein YabQ [Defluviitaleaceae bacterium]
MILSMSEQVYTFASLVAVGFIVGFFYDFIRLVRRFINHSALACNIEDGLYWVLALLGVFYFMLNNFYGEIRFFSIMGFFIGMALYFLSISALVLGILGIIWAFSAKVIKTTIKIILYPIKVLINIIKIPLSFILFLYRKYGAKTKKVLHKSSKYAKIKSRKLRRDLSIIVKRV